MRLDWRLLDDDGRIDLDKWALRHQLGTAVGRCDCGTDVLVDGAAPWELVRGVRWLSTRCPACGAETSSPEGRVAQRRHDPALR